MPLYDYDCEICGSKEDNVFHSVSECGNERICPLCGEKMRRIIKAHHVRVFVPQFVDDGAYVRNKQELKDHINRYNDSHQAQKTGKIAVFEQLSGREF